MIPVRHIYVHVPFCDGRCVYCGFYSVRGTPAQHVRYAPLPAREIGRTPVLGCPETLYVGGGTPSALGMELDRLLHALRDVLDLSELREWSVESSPGHVTTANARRWVSRGVDRVSLGAQSFDDTVLRAMGRRHCAKDTAHAVAALRRAGLPSIGLDLIAGWPGMGMEAWRRDLDAALALEPDHVSVYTLSLEPGSRLACCAPRLDDDDLMDRIALAESRLHAGGFERYEISNYARPGHACRHHLAVWQGHDYLGIGPSAASRRGCRRWSNPADLEGYMASIEAGSRPSVPAGRLTAPDDLEERFMTGLRLSRGVDPESFVASVAPRLRAIARSWTMRLHALETCGLVCRSSKRWRLTARGREVADGVMRELVQPPKRREIIGGGNERTRKYKCRPGDGLAEPGIGAGSIPG